MVVPIAKILSTHGLKGEVKVSPFIFNFEVFSQIKKFYLDKEKTQVLITQSIRYNPKKHLCIIKFEKISFEEAEELVGKVLYVEISELPSEKEDEFYYYQLIGAEVLDEKGKSWGKVKEIMPIGEYELLLVKHKDKDFYIPLISEYVEEINTKEKQILVKNIEDLFKVQC